MIELTQLLTQLKQQLPQSTGQPLYQSNSQYSSLIDQALILAETMQDELNTTKQVIQDIRTRDANKKCLCRGQ